MTISTSVPTLLLGTSNVGPAPASTPFTHDSAEKVAALLDCWYDLGGRYIDTAAQYGETKEHDAGGSERRLKEADAGDRFVIDTKVYDPPVHDGAFADDNIRRSVDQSLVNLGSKINILYLHHPDRTTPYEHVLRELDILHREGKFQKLGISNYTPEQTERLCEVADANGWIKPSVYQGNYSAIARASEEALFPVLRKHGVSFYAYSPLAMGMLAGGKQKESLEAAQTLPPGSRFHPESRKGVNFQKSWFKQENFEAVKILNRTATESGIAPTALSLRWLAHHSALKAELGDGIILGASSTKQLQETVSAFSGGPLGATQVQAFEHMWEICKDVAPRLRA